MWLLLEMFKSLGAYDTKMVKRGLAANAAELFPASPCKRKEPSCK
jgi:hypothetical protein